MRRAARPVPGRGPLHALRAPALALSGVVLGLGALLVLRGGDPSTAAGGAPSRAEAAAGASAEAGPPGPMPEAAGPPAAADRTGLQAAPAGPPPTDQQAPPSQAGPPVAEQAPPKTPVPGPAQRPALTVLNNSRIPSLAERQAARLRAAGWPVDVVGNFAGRIAATTVYYAAGQREQAAAVAVKIGARRVLPRFAGLPGRGLTVVVTRDLA